MPNAAHAAAWHWESIGTDLHRMRVLMLLAQAHPQAGLGETALTYAEEMRSCFLAMPGTPDWELAFAHVVHAHAVSAAGDRGKHVHSYAEACGALCWALIAVLISRHRHPGAA